MTKPNLAILGLGSRSTTFYINELNSLYKKKNGGYSTFPFLLLNSNFDWINKLLPHVSKELDRMFRLVMENYVTSIEGYYKSYLFLTAKEKYNLILELMLIALFSVLLASFWLPLLM